MAESQNDFILIFLTLSNEGSLISFHFKKMSKKNISRLCTLCINGVITELTLKGKAKHLPGTKLECPILCIYLCKLSLLFSRVLPLRLIEFKANGRNTARGL